MRQPLIAAALAVSVLTLGFTLTPAYAMCADGVCGLESHQTQADGQQPQSQSQAQSQSQPPSAMPGMTMGGMMGMRGQGGQAQGMGMMMNCPMMKQMAALQDRVRAMEDMMGMTKQN